MAFTPQRLPFYTPSLPIAKPASISEPSALASGSQPGTVPTRILLLSDTHNVPLFPPNDPRHAFKAPLPRADVVLHAGDLSNSGRPEQLAVTFNMLTSIEAELKLVIAGNHDLQLDVDFWRKLRRSGVRRGRFQAQSPDSGKERDASERERAAIEEVRVAREMWTSEEAQRRGIQYLDEGMHEFTLSNGAYFTIYASPYSPEFSDWAFMTPHAVDRYNPQETTDRGSILSRFRLRKGDHKPQPAQNTIPDHPNVDIVMTHGPPQYILDRTSSTRYVGCEHLLRALVRARPRLCVFGHIHEDWGVMRANWRTGKGVCLDVSGRGDVEDGTSEEPEEIWDRVVERGFVGVNMTGGGESGLGKVVKGRRKADEDQEDEVGSLEASQEEVTTFCIDDSQDTLPGMTESDGQADVEFDNGMLSVPPITWGDETLCVNAAIMDSRFRAMNSPIVVDLLLARKTG